MTSRKNKSENDLPLDAEDLFDSPDSEGSESEAYEHPLVAVSNEEHLPALSNPAGPEQSGPPSLSAGNQSIRALNSGRGG